MAQNYSGALHRWKAQAAERAAGEREAEDAEFLHRVRRDTFAAMDENQDTEEGEARERDEPVYVQMREEEERWFPMPPQRDRSKPSPFVLGLLGLSWFVMFALSLLKGNVRPLPAQR